MGNLSRLSQWFRGLGLSMQFLVAVLAALFGLAMVLLLLYLLSSLNLFGGPSASAQPTVTPGATVTIAPATTAPAATTTAQPTATIPPEDTRLAPPENFDVTAQGTTFTVVWAYPAGQSLEPTFFRVSVMGMPTDFAYAGPVDYEEEVNAVCGQTNFVTLDAFNTDVEPEANAQAQNVVQIEPDC